MTLYGKLHLSVVKIVLNDCITVHNEQERRRQYAALYPRCPDLDAALDKNAKVERYNPPIVKSFAELAPGDICRSEFGNDDNWTDFIFVRFGYTDDKWTEKVNKYFGYDKEIKTWTQTPYDRGLAYVVGRVKQ